LSKRIAGGARAQQGTIDLKKMNADVEAMKKEIEEIEAENVVEMA
jgi:cell division protein FtsB